MIVSSCCACSEELGPTTLSVPYELDNTTAQIVPSWVRSLLLYFASVTFAKYLLMFHLNQGPRLSNFALHFPVAPPHTEGPYPADVEHLGQQGPHPRAALQQALYVPPSDSALMQSLCNTATGFMLLRPALAPGDGGNSRAGRPADGAHAGRRL